MATKEFDCIAFKREASTRIFNTVKDMSSEDELAYWRHRERDLRNWLGIEPGSNSGGEVSRDAKTQK